MRELEALRIISESSSTQEQLDEAFGFLNKNKDERYKKIIKLSRTEKIKRFIKITENTKDGISDNPAVLKAEKDRQDNIDKLNQEQDGIDFTKYKYKSILSLSKIDGYTFLIENNNNEVDAVYYVNKAGKVKSIGFVSIDNLIYKNEK